MSPLAVDSLVAETVPFEHAAAPDFVGAELGDRVLSWLETSVSWQEKEIPGFVTLEECNLERVPMPAAIASLRDPATEAALRAMLGRLFGRAPEGKMSLGAHRMKAGTSIRVHTDTDEGQHQTYRVLLQLNRGWSVAHGGLLMFFDEREPAGVSPLHRYFVPSHCSAVAFKITERAFHAVSPVAEGVRYTLTYSFEQ
jgi:hypothetical protein